MADEQAAGEDIPAGERLRDAARHGDTATVQALLRRPDAKDFIEHGDWDGRTALIEAARWGKAEALKLLLAAGADVNAKDRAGMTALMWASGFSDAEPMQLLIANGAQVNMKTPDGWTALMWAASQGATEAVKLLLERGAEVNIKDEQGRTALTLATHFAHHDTAEVLKRPLPLKSPILEDAMSVVEEFLKQAAEAFNSTMAWKVSYAMNPAAVHASEALALAWAASRFADLQNPGHFAAASEQNAQAFKYALASSGCNVPEAAFQEFDQAVSKLLSKERPIPWGKISYVPES